jgi:DNA-binding transcriptional regulator YhcF (GntR family)
MSNIVGHKVIKKSLKPFKSKLKVNTIKEITINPNTQKEAYTFLEDDSIVDSYQCISFQNFESLESKRVDGQIFLKVKDKWFKND